jgi:hypothetical protein
MTKNTKTLLVVGAVAVVGYLIWKQRLSASTTVTASTSTGFAGNVGPRNYFVNAGGRTETATTCRSGEVLCPNNPRKCYDPRVNYVVDPCSNRTF